ncbi:hypothetical protein SOV_04750 [Sporomusa ovata DSM 2662]|uniref:Phage neck terminator protein gp12-like domain-containing protein n=1 Tax=Sporomusa ovata TaxID=2378 RepID=A0A0U1KX46_9FIRM|nr:hypothetical protein [Sporomusa ovata]EQB28145.1 hypothetical protein SOV_2c10680 [Sporomusa ovata DSM 2662]CQR71679.1 hypothetical protein SpAn4DRAFT_3545 [Sporomusa ovata]
MADLFLTRKQLEKLFWRVTTLMLGFDPALTINANKVRISWPTEGAPSWKIDEDVIFLRIYEQDDEFNVIRDTVYQAIDQDNIQQSNAYTRVLRAHWFCYGPNSFDNASRIRNLLYVDQYRQPLADNQIFLIPRIDTPHRSPELFAGQWWERTDLAANFNELVRFDSEVPYLKSAEITVGSDTPASADASVDQNTKTH